MCIILGLCILAVIFYYPEAEPIVSRYAHASDVFERSAGLINPEYRDYYQLIKWEGLFPMHTILARFTLYIFRDNINLAITWLYMPLAIFAAVLTYLANCLYLRRLQAFLITILLMFGRIIMPVARGLGVMGALFLIPLVLYFMHYMCKSQQVRARKKGDLGKIAMLGVCASVIYCLGGHQTLFGLYAVTGILFIFLCRFIVQRIKRKQASLLTGTAALGLVSAVIFTVLIMSVGVYGVHANQEPVSLSDALFHKQFFSSYFLRDFKKEPALARKNRKLLVRSTFVEGKYLVKRGDWHKNCFLYPGAGFNGIIPIFVAIGFLIGILPFLRKLYNSLKDIDGNSFHSTSNYFILLNGLLFALFLVTLYLSGDPKPTRYGLSVYSIFVISAFGYTRLFEGIVKAKKVPMITNKGGMIKAIKEGLIVILAVLLIRAVLCMLHKNYVDLQDYYQEYKNEIPTIALNPIMENYDKEHTKKTVFVLGHFPKGGVRNPAVGLFMRFNMRENIKTVPTRLYSLLPDGSVIYVRNKSGDVTRIK